MGHAVAMRVPMLVAGVDVYSLPLSTMEGFVLSRVDGASRVEDIAMMTGVPEPDLAGILERLEGLGAVVLPWKPKRVSSPAGPVGPAKASKQAAGGPEGLYDDVDADYELSELDEAAEIDLATRRRVLNAFYTVQDRNLYEVLGVSIEADKKEIRAAYFALSKRFHPDAYFGQRLGGYGAKLEAVFKRLTEAYETLGRKKRRADYDQYLATTTATRLATESLAQAQHEAEQLRHAPPAPPVPDMPSSEALRAPRVPSVPEPARRPRRRGSSQPIDRRKLAAQRLRRQFDSRPPPRATPLTPPRAPSAPPPPHADLTPEERRDSVIKDLARTLKSSHDLTDSPEIRVQRYVRDAAEAEERGDVLSAANTLQLALALLPEHAEAREAYQRVSVSVARTLADNYEKQARYEQRVGKWAQAAKSWARVVEGRPEQAEPAREAAASLLRSSGDLHAAQRYAESACRLQPNEIENLIVLIEVCLAAGLKLNARRELEKAVKLDPKNEVVKNLLREAKEAK